MRPLRSVACALVVCVLATPTLAGDTLMSAKTLVGTDVCAADGSVLGTVYGLRLDLAAWKVSQIAVELDNYAIGIVSLQLVSAVSSDCLRLYSTSIIAPFDPVLHAAIFTSFYPIDDRFQITDKLNAQRPLSDFAFDIRSGKIMRLKAGKGFRTYEIKPTDVKVTGAAMRLNLDSFSELPHAAWPKLDYLSLGSELFVTVGK